MTQSAASPMVGNAIFGVSPSWLSGRAGAFVIPGKTTSAGDHDDDQRRRPGARSIGTPSCRTPALMQRGDEEAEAPHAVRPVHDAIAELRLVPVGLEIDVDLERAGKEAGEEEQRRDADRPTAGTG